MHCRIRKGFTFIEVLISLFLLAVGVIFLLKVFFVISRLSSKAEDYLSNSFIADKIFLSIKKEYGDRNKKLPEFIEGKLYDYPEFSYIAKFYKEKEDFYKIELLVKWKREGRVKKRYFYGYLRRE
ncbi:MAG: hypothetical protein DRP67_01375 [Candidatus Omnitrophota bacterium]|nr:MAG: hypothetical protein DRP67_01375 [Candidatus Omnitrophota bacterium]